MNASPVFRLHPGPGVVFAAGGTVVVVAPGWCSVRELAQLLGTGEHVDDHLAEQLTTSGAAGVGWARRREDGSVELQARGAVKLSLEGGVGGAAASDGPTSVTRGSWLLAADGASGPPVEGTWLAAGLVVAGGVSGTVAEQAELDHRAGPEAVETTSGRSAPDVLSAPVRREPEPPAPDPVRRVPDPEPSAPPSTELSPPTGVVPAVPLAPTAPPPQPAAPSDRPAPAPSPPVAPAPSGPTSHPPPPPPRPPAPSASPSADAPQGPPPPTTPGTFIDLRAPVASRDPLPRLVVDDRAVQVRGVHCRNGHFNNPLGRLCYLCGDNMQNQSITIGPSGEIGVLGNRPPLGILTLDDGSIYQLSDDLVLGRDPISEGNLAAVVNDASVSRNHLRVHLHEWEVLVEDLHSSNGSHVLAPGASVYQPLVPGTPTALRSGTILAFGQRWASFESTAAAG